MKFPAPTKLEHKIKLLIRDCQEKNQGDIIKRSKEIISFLIEKALKKHYTGNYWDFRKKSIEEKLGFLLDKVVIGEYLFDNCILTKELRNPTEHHFTEPRSSFAIGALKTVIELYFNLQIDLKLPEIPELIELSKKINTAWPFGIVINLNSIDKDKVTKIKKVIAENIGDDTVLLIFNDGNKEPKQIQLEKKLNIMKNLFQI